MEVIIVWISNRILHNSISYDRNFFVWISVKRNTKKNAIEKQRMDVTLNFKLTFLWIFGLASIFNSALNMGLVIDSLYLNFGCQLFRTVLYKISIAISLVEICFCARQLGFLSLYGKFLHLRA